MQEYAVAEMWTDARVQRIYGGTNEIMKELIARGFVEKRVTRTSGMRRLDENNDD